MGVYDSKTFPGDAKTPICNMCNVSLCWDIGNDEYYEDKIFWDNWICKDCNPNYKYNKKNKL